MTASTMPAPAARLRGQFDGAGLAAELDCVRQHSWSRQRVYGDTVGVPAAIDWRCLALRSAGGAADRTDPGGPGLEDFADTPWLSSTPLTSAILDKIPVPKRAVRFMALGPGVVSHTHDDTKYGPRWGVARLHIPITTNPDALLVLDSVEYRWQPGEFWFGDFSRKHRVENHGAQARVHLVIDTLMTEAISQVFPAEWEQYLLDGEVLLNRPETARRGPADGWECDLVLPVGFADWEQPDRALETDADLVPATVRSLPDDGLCLTVAEQPPIRLVHVADGEFRFAGWSQERTIQLPPAGEGEAVLRTRAGCSTTTRAVSARRTG
jgi:hypothetical protein